MVTDFVLCTHKETLVFIGLHFNFGANIMCFQTLQDGLYLPHFHAVISSDTLNPIGKHCRLDILIWKYKKADDEYCKIQAL